jgi:hypothetical protein
MRTTTATDTAVAAIRSGPLLTARYALNGHGHHVSHLVVGDSGRSLCGVLAGDAAPHVTCASCAYRYARTPEGGRIARAAADHAVRAHVNAQTAASYHRAADRAADDAAQRALWEQVAATFEVRS